MEFKLIKGSYNNTDIVYMLKKLKEKDFELYDTFIEYYGNQDLYVGLLNPKLETEQYSYTEIVWCGDSVDSAICNHIDCLTDNAYIYYCEYDIETSDTILLKNAISELENIAKDY